MSFSESISACFGKYATFAGRASRSEFWWFYLFTVLMSWGSMIVGAVAFGETGGPLFSNLVSLAFFLPSLAVGARRLHDKGRTGWWQLLSFTVVGIIVLIVWWASEGDGDTNEYGEALTSPAA